MAASNSHTPSPDLPSADRDREARIAELRAQRRSRRRKLGRRGALGTLALIVLLAAGVWWLLWSIGGRDFLLAQVKARLPAGTELHWSRAEGPASGPLILHDVRFISRGCPAVNEQPVAYPNCEHPRITTFTAQRVLVDPALRPLFGKRLRLDALQVSGATLDLPDSDEPFELPRWPDSLPQIAPPLALEADTIRIDGLRVTRQGEGLIDIASARGGLRAATGELRIERLQVDSDRGRFTAHGRYAPKDDYAMDLTASAVLPARTGRTPARLGLAARGDLARMHVALAGNAPAPLTAALTLQGKDQPRWTLTANTAALDLGLLTDANAAPSATPLALDLRANGTGGVMQAQGTLTQGELSVTLRPSLITLENQILRAHPVVLETFGGSVRLNGQADFTARENPRYRFAINARGLRWGGAAAANGKAATPAIMADGDIGLAGTLKQWAAIGNATLARDGQRAQLTLDTRGNADGATLRSLAVRMPSGRLDATGTVAWSPLLRWQVDAQLAGFDPGYFVPDWPGAVNGRIQSTGQREASGALQATVDVPDIGGRLRARALDGRGDARIRWPAQGDVQIDGALAVSMGASRVQARGRIAQTLDIDAQLTPLQLADFLPTAAGSVRGTLQLTGPRNAPTIDADLSGSEVRYGDYQAQSFVAQGRLPWRGDRGTLSLRAQQLQAGIALDSLQIEARGAVENLQLQAQARNEALGDVSLQGSALRQGGNWRGELAQLQLTPVRGASWRLQDPARYAQNGARWTLSPSCFASTGGGSLCASADWPRQGLQLRGEGLPLTLLSPYLPEPEDGRRFILNGLVALDAQLRPVGNAWAGHAQVRSASGGLRLSERARRDLIGYRDLRLDARFDPQQVQGTLAAGLSDGGRVDARLATGWDDYAPLAGEIAVNTSELTWLELFSPDIVEPQGRLQGRITLAGTRAQPSLGGQAQLTGFSTELPALNIALSNGVAQLVAQADGTARITGAVRSGQGTLNIDGSLGWRGGDTPLVLNLTGSNVLASDTRDLHAVIDPNLTVRYQAGQPLQVTGTVAVPEARLDLERLDDGVSASPDVVVLDPATPETAGAASTLALDLTVAVGDDVQLRGFGLDGSLSGNLRVRAQPGREMTGSGALEVGGRYAAYGQRLQITRGRLLWSNSPIADPLLDIRAEREIGDVTAGIAVTGRASAPDARAYSNQPGSQTDALAYLTLGRPLSGLSGDEARQVNAASAALTAGGSVLASQLGARLGLDDAGMMQTRTAGSVFGIGKYLSPRVYVGYGVSLLGNSQVIMLKYLLRKGFDIQIESSSVENRGSINWRKEK